MKNWHKFAIALLIIAGCLWLSRVAKAGVFVWAGAGVNIAANSSTNFTNMTLPVVGTFNLSAVNLYMSEAGITNTNQVTVSNLISFDGVHFFTLSQLYIFPTTNAVTNILNQVTNVSIPIYGALAVSNGQSQIVTNFSAVAQF